MLRPDSVVQAILLKVISSPKMSELLLLTMPQKIFSLFKEGRVSEFTLLEGSSNGRCHGFSQHFSVTLNNGEQLL